MFPIDSALFMLLNATEATPGWVLGLARFASLDLPQWLLLGAVGAAVRGGPQVRAMLWRALLAMVLAWSCARLVQHLMPMPRPSAHGLGTAWLTGRDGPRFPSTHASVACAFAWALARQVRQTWLCGAAFGLAALIAWSRICLGLHYPTDVAAGALLGACCAWSVTRQSWHASATRWRSPPLTELRG